jgi:two-component system cell cycle response regulator CtrA
MSPVERRLREENEHLREEVRYLRDLLTPPGFLPAMFPLTATEERAFKALLSREQWSKEALLASIYYDSQECDIPEIKIIDVIICKLRKKIKHLGIEIETFWNKGYRIAPHMKAKVALILEKELASDRAKTLGVLEGKTDDTAQESPVASD